MATLRRACMAALTRLAFALAAAFASAASVHASPLSIAIDTSALSGVAADLALDFIDGGPPSNRIDISGFVTDGVLGATALSGSASFGPSGAGELDDSSFFNEILQSISLGDSIAFLMTPTQHGPDLGSSPDAFSIFLLDHATGLPLFDTSDPTGADALLLFEITGPGSGRTVVYEPTSSPAATLRVAVVGPPGTVPLPPTFWLVVVGLVGLAAVRSRFREVFP